MELEYRVGFFFSFLILFNTLSQFEQILTIDKKNFLVERPLTKGDCEFLLKVGITARPKQLMLRVASAKKDLVQEYGILLKFLSGKKQHQLYINQTRNSNLERLSLSQFHFQQGNLIDVSL